MSKKKGQRRGSFGVFFSLFNGIKKLIYFIISLWIAGVLLFAFLPVPYSLVMAERQLSAWLAGQFNYVAQQTWVPLEQISSYMALAVIAAEDQKFPQHWGFDTQAIRAALVHNTDHPSKLRGGSTLSQQTAKNLFLWDGRSWLRKGFEAGLTIAIELVWSKARILTVYLNIAEFGEGIFGVEQAAQHFFNKSAKQLTAEEATLLAAVLPNPIRFQVNHPSSYVLQRQRWILQQMEQLGGVTILKNL